MPAGNNESITLRSELRGDEHFLRRLPMLGLPQVRSLGHPVAVSLDRLPDPGGDRSGIPERHSAALLLFPPASRLQRLGTDLFQREDAQSLSQGEEAAKDP